MRPIAVLKGASRSIHPPFHVPNFRASYGCHLARRYLSQNTNGHIAQLLEFKPDSAAKNVVINGYVRSLSKTKQHRFISLGDGSSSRSLQVVAARELTDGLSVGTAICLTGSWEPSLGALQSHELHAEKIEIVGPSNAKTYPIQKKFHTPEFLRTLPHLRPRTTLNSGLLRLRSQVIASLTNFFAQHHFTQTHPPILTSSDCEGAGEVFKITPATEIPSTPSIENRKQPEYFGSTKYLTVSTQLHLEALALGVGNVWTLSPVFRAEKSDTSRHLSEFYMLEAEMSFVEELGSVMDLAEAMLRTLSIDLSESAVVQELASRSDREQMGYVSNDQVKQRWEGLKQDSWPRITYTDAVALIQDKASLMECKPPVWGEGLQAEHEKFLAEYVGGGSKPVFVVNYPQDIKAFYMRASQPPSTNITQPGQTAPGATVDCFDLLVPEFCEIAGGSMREHRLEPLLAAMYKQGLAGNPNAEGQVDNQKASPLEWYADLRRWGCPPHGGFGIGFDRLLCYLSGVPTVRDIVAFPRYFGRCDC
ncbi:hypothetical protein QBC37DRAFT_198507 [Rhypophila decipiens]|uniref:asparagine--tRNA ligase n=1 Tax=Rhypophila decipiens TaxID=261697 RepID=A0AAN6YFF2_9PEZI|nr:hypothetical protein QBC37DRAFT_198507 [Rhypophila decipiens]